MKGLSQKDAAAGAKSTMLQVGKPSKQLEDVIASMEMLVDNQMAMQSLQSQQSLLRTKLRKDTCGLSDYAIDLGIQSFQQTGKWSVLKNACQSGLLCAFEKKDRNHDGVLSDEEMPGVLAADTDHTGDTSLAEIHNHCNSVPQLAAKGHAATAETLLEFGEKPPVVAECMAGAGLLAYCCCDRVVRSDEEVVVDTTSTTTTTSIHITRPTRRCIIADYDYQQNIKKEE
ncbi:unnamed protein product [Amoebophrya sp. A120]|nr:unnamed protein product [Amoebophrya sp. A120]|eukprot:GSA120T00019864001.1